MKSRSDSMIRGEWVGIAIVGREVGIVYTIAEA
jgi:hypothetical protein